MPSTIAEINKLFADGIRASRDAVYTSRAVASVREPS